LVYVSVKLVFGTLYPAYCSFKAVKNKNVKEYVQWMTYWIVLSLMTVAEQITDLFLGFWFPLYYELKILLLIWLLSPTTRGATFLYRQVIHPTLTKREEDIDDFVQKCKDDGMKYTRSVAQKMTSSVIETALASGGGLVRSIKHSYSISDLRSGYQEQEYGSRYHDKEGYGSRYNEQGYRSEQAEHLEEYSRHQEYERSVKEVKMRTVRGRSRVPLESTVSLTSDSDVLRAWSGEKRNSRRRKTSSMYGTLPKSGNYGAMSRTRSRYEMLGKRTRTLTKEDLKKDEAQVESPYT